MAADRQTDRQTYTRVSQYSHASVGLAQARPKYVCTKLDSVSFLTFKKVVSTMLMFGVQSLKQMIKPVCCFCGSSPIYPPDVIHVMNAHRPFQFSSPYIIVNANEGKDGGGLVMRLRLSYHSELQQIKYPEFNLDIERFETGEVLGDFITDTCRQINQCSTLYHLFIL